MDARALLAEMLAEIALEEKALEQKRIAVEYLKRRINGQETKVVQSEMPIVTFSGLQHMRSRYHSRPEAFPPIDPPLSVTAQVTGIVEGFLDAAFDVNAVYDQFKKQNRPLPPKTLLSTALTRLADKGEIEIVERGAGSVPNRYRRAQARTASPPAAEDSSQAGGGGVDDLV